MEDIIIVVIVLVIVMGGIFYTKKHFSKKGGCCGGGSSYVSKKKLKNVMYKKTFIIDDMTCEHCKSRVEMTINDIEGLVGKVNLSRKELVVSYEKEVSDDVIIAALNKAGYLNIR